MLKRTFYGQSTDNPTNIFRIYSICRCRFIIYETSFRLEFRIIYLAIFQIT